MSYTTLKLSECPDERLDLKNAALAKFIGGNELNGTWHFPDERLKSCKKLPFDKDWNAIMIVAEKLGNEGDFIVISRSATGDRVTVVAFDKNLNYEMIMEEVPENTFIETVFECLYQYVLWRHKNPI